MNQYNDKTNTFIIHFYNFDYFLNNFSKFLKTIFINKIIDNT